MSYATYSAATGLPPIHPNQTVTFRTHTNRDKTFDNKTVVRKARLPRGSAIRSQRMYASATIAAGTASASMPFAGNLYLTVANAAAGNTVVIANPFVTGNASQAVILNNGPDSTATVAVAPGQITLTLTAGTNGVYVISVRV